MLEKGRKWQKVEQKDKKLNHCKVDEFQMCMALPCFFFLTVNESDKWMEELRSYVPNLVQNEQGDMTSQMRCQAVKNHNTNIQHSEVLHEFIIVIIVIIIIITS